VGELKDNKIVQVCSACKRASCWYGQFMCDESKTADTEFHTVKELRDMKTSESEHYWSDEYMSKIYGSPDGFGYKEVIEDEYIKRSEGCN